MVEQRERCKEGAVAEEEMETEDTEVPGSPAPPPSWRKDVPYLDEMWFCAARTPVSLSSSH